MISVYKFTLWYPYIDEYQERYVVAADEDEAISKMEKYRDELMAKGFANFGFSYCPIVEIQDVIV